MIYVEGEGDGDARLWVGGLGERYGTVLCDGLGLRRPLVPFLFTAKMI